MAEDPEIKRLYCNSCAQETHHQLKGSHKQACDFVDDVGCGLVRYLLWACRGCDTGVLETAYWTDSMEWAIEYDYFPERSQHFLLPKPYSKLTASLMAIYREVITCYNQEAFILCAAGLRALLEGICHDKKVKGFNNETRIDGLKEFLPNENIVRNLHCFRFMGNEAIHELAEPNPAEVALAIGIIEDLLNFFYELDYKASQLQKMHWGQNIDTEWTSPKGIREVTLAHSGKVIKSVRRSRTFAAMNRAGRRSKAAPPETVKDAPKKETA
jgi:hypothetical protein